MSGKRGRGVLKFSEGGGRFFKRPAGVATFRLCSLETSRSQPSSPRTTRQVSNHECAGLHDGGSALFDSCFVAGAARAMPPSFILTRVHLDFLSTATSFDTASMLRTCAGVAECDGAADSNSNRKYVEGASDSEARRRSRRHTEAERRLSGAATAGVVACARRPTAPTSSPGCSNSGLGEVS